MGSNRVVGSIERLPSRFRAAEADLTARFRLVVGDVRRDVIISRGDCSVVPVDDSVPDVEICTAPDTWHRIDAGELSGIEAFADRKLTIRGSIDKSLQFEPLFDRPRAGGVRYHLENVKVRRASISTLVAGDPHSQPVVLLHGLGATKASWLTIVAGLAHNYRVIAIDLPGFGSSSKPLGRYDPPWFARHIGGLLDELGHRRAFFAGNSMGGRVAMEVAMAHPERVDGIACLCPAAAFMHRPAIFVARLLRPELGVLAGRLPRRRMKEGLRQLFADPSCVAEDWYDAAIDDFLAVWKSPRARVAFSRSLRNIYLDQPDGEAGFWARLARVEAPALYIYGRRDVLITHRFGDKIRTTMPHARVEVWRNCGHVPQIEHPDRTIQTLHRFFRSARIPAEAAV